MKYLELTARAASVLLVLGLSACTTTAVDDDDGSGEGEGEGEPTPAGIPLLGNYQHTPDAVDMTVISQPADQLATPRDVAFNPLAPNELWIVNRATNSVAICLDPGTASQQFFAPTGFGADHFLVQPSAIAFGNNGFFASIHETDDQTQGSDGTPADFMGPTLWPSNRAEYEGGHASHYDMLHNSPNGMGIAWQRDNVYWVFDGYHSAITMYDFNGDHGPGGADHSDGIVRRYVEGEVTWYENVPSHMVFHPTQPHLLLVADSGNNRIAVLDTTSGTPGAEIFPNYDGSDQSSVNGATITTLIDGASVGMGIPSGLTLYGDIILVSDAGNSVIWAFTLEGELVDWLETGLPGGSTMGTAIDQNGHLFFADATSNQVWRIAPLEEPAL